MSDIVKSHSTSLSSSAPTSTLETTETVNLYKSPESTLVSDAKLSYQSTKRVIDRFLATCLIVGGLSGIALSILSAMDTEAQVTIALFTVFYLALSVWHVLKGADLWKGKASGYLWGKIFFAFQIPVITSSFLVYNHFTGVFLGLWLENLSVIFKAFFSGGLQLSLASEPMPFSLGINIFAVVALIYLLKRQTGIKL